MYKDYNYSPSASRTPVTSGEEVTIDGVVVKVGNNGNSAMPRSYRYSSTNPVAGDYYTWYAATAESAPYDANAAAEAVDTICPSGWAIPSSNGEAGKTFAGLFSQYTKENGDPLGSDTESISIAMKYPLSLAWTGWLAYYNGLPGVTNRRINYWTTTRPYYNTQASDMRIYNGNFDFDPLHNQNNVYGSNIRCVLK